MTTKHVKTIGTLAPGDIGQLEAVFSVFNMVDSDGDVVLPSAFKDGQDVPMVWSHDWTKPIGKGTIRVESDRAVFSGAFFMDTIAGGDAYRTVKGMGGLQEYSWGFRVTDSERGQFDGQAVRFIKATDVYEVSPTLVGANRQTGTLALKEAKYGSMGMSGAEPPDGSYEALSEDIEEAIEAAMIPAGTYGYVCVIATYTTHAVASVYLPDQDEATFYDIPYSVGSDGETITLGPPTEVEMETTFAPKGRTAEYGLHAAQVERTVHAFIERTKAGSAIRRKEGRPISEARRTRMAAIRDGLRTSADDLHAILDETAPKEPAKTIDLSHELTAFLAFEARRNGVLLGA